MTTPEPLLTPLDADSSEGLRVYDPALCCSSGVCGPEPEDDLIRFAADAAWLASRGIPVKRFNLGHEPSAFAAEPRIRKALAARGMGCLPIVLLNGEVLTEGRYPTRDEVMVRHG